MNIGFTPDAWEEYLYWQKNDRNVLKKINDLIRDIKRNPFEGRGKPEPLRFQLSGCWSRRIDREHRLVYSISGTAVHIISCRFHY